LKQYGVSAISELPVNYNGLVMQESERLTTGVYREHQSRQLRQMQRQSDWIRPWLWLSPALALQYAQMAAAGNDLAHHRHFLQQAEERRYRLIQYLNSLHTYRIHQHDDKNQRIDASFWQAAPRPGIHPAPVQVSQSQIAASVLTLLGWIGLTLFVLRRTLHHHET
jgi:ABC-2 type transport system permease protein